MITFIKTIRSCEKKIVHTTEFFSLHHPIAAFLIMVVGVPLIMLLSVAIMTMAIALPIAVILGWI